MKVRIELSDYEIRTALQKAIKEKMADLHFYPSDVKVSGSVKFKGKALRKPVLRMAATVEVTK